MQSQHSFKTAFCTEYEKLLFACQKALEDWRTRREEVEAIGFVSKRTADDLVKLQTNYARAYTKLESHEDFCELCQFVTRIGEQNVAPISTSALESKYFA
jgi:hypothetical protein